MPISRTSQTSGRLDVLHVITDRDRRGAQVFATDLAAGLDAIGGTNRVVALAPGLHGDRLEVPTLGPRRRSPSTLRALRHAAHSADIVVAHGSATLLACSLALLGSRRPFVYRQISDPLHWAGTWGRRVRVGVMLRRAACIVALAESSASALCQHYRLRRDAITVLPNAVPHEGFRRPTATQMAAARSALGLPADATVALSIGALAPEKGVDMTIRSLAGCPGLHLVVAGEGPERDRLCQLANATAPGRVHFVGSVDDVRIVFHAVDLVVLPSRAGDSMPAVLIEAGLCGLPAVATDVGAITDVVLDRHTGIIVPVEDQRALDDAMSALAADAEQRSTLGHNAEAHCLANFTIAATAPRWMELLRTHSRRRD